MDTMIDEKGKQKPFPCTLIAWGKHVCNEQSPQMSFIHIEAHVKKGKITHRQSLTSVTPSAEIWNRASASAKHGELITLQILSSPRPFRSASLQ